MRNTGIQIRVSDLLFALQKRWKVIVSTTLVGLLFGMILSAMTYVQASFQSYSVNGSFAITTKNASGLYINNAPGANNNDYHLAEDMMDAVHYILRCDRVMNQVIDDQQILGTTAAQLRSNLYVTQHNTTQIIEMSLTWRNADEGLAIWNAVVTFASELLPETLQLGTLAIINEPEAVLVGVGGSGGNLWMFLTLLGFAAGIGFAVIELLMHPTLNNVNDVESQFGLETIGVIPQDKEFFKRKTSILVQNGTDHSEVMQNYAAAAYILRNRLGTKEAHHCFYVTSATMGEGKTTVAANLAIQLSDMEHRTLLIDFDTLNPTLGALFLNEVDYNHSINALYRGEATEEEAITQLTGYLDILPMVLEHNAIMMDGAIVELIERLVQQYEYVILDAAPVGMVSSTLSLNQVASTVLYVVGYDKATIPEIHDSLEKLDKSGIRVLGCVVNNVQSGLNSGSDGKNKQKNRKKSSKKEEVFVPSAKPQEENEVEELVESQKDRKTKAKQKKKKTKGRSQSKEEVIEEQAKAEQPKPAAEVIAAGPKNVMEDLMREEEVTAQRTDRETVDALLKFGISGDWGTEEQSPNAQNAEEVPEQDEAAIAHEEETAEQSPDAQDTEETKKQDEAPIVHEEETAEQSPTRKTQEPTE